MESEARTPTEYIEEAKRCAKEKSRRLTADQLHKLGMEKCADGLQNLLTGMAMVHWAAASNLDQFSDTLINELDLLQEQIRSWVSRQETVEEDIVELDRENEQMLDLEDYKKNEREERQHPPTPIQSPTKKKSKHSTHQEINGDKSQHREKNKKETDKKKRPTTNKQSANKKRPPTELELAQMTPEVREIHDPLSLRNTKSAKKTPPTQLELAQMTPEMREIHDPLSRRNILTPCIHLFPDVKLPAGYRYRRPNDPRLVIGKRYMAWGNYNLALGNNVPEDFWKLIYYHGEQRTKLLVGNPMTSMQPPKPTDGHTATHLCRESFQCRQRAILIEIDD